MPVSVSCFCLVSGEGGAPVCLCQFPAPGTFREKEEILPACVSLLLLPRYGRGGSSAGLPSPPGVGQRDACESARPGSSSSDTCRSCRSLFHQVPARRRL